MDVGSLASSGAVKWVSQLKTMCDAVTVCKAFHTHMGVGVVLKEETR